ncbi:ribbon-helix-helix domain-containing protein [Granulicella tundricola]|uniref:Addiction module antidote protein, CC2985 family n=1 Tax=Granulicella tundricola (strain ATCC BAA-1859 / DSM 23138 / MP5ACTX9) TaxID=1198114 RepID=E8WVX6_GRATM|nr:type II toxin-antitoxin system ParD family antitoxin [Granulicella tundricola]ADW70735.1 hypothetical protein AciX9_3734 [Granulicella tundricola MP5ACTX9]
MAASETISVALSPEILTVVHEAVEAGEYASSGDVVRDALQEWTEARRLRQVEHGDLRRLWQQSIESDVSVSADEVLDRLERKYQLMADQAAEAK